MNYFCERGKWLLGYQNLHQHQLSGRLISTRSYVGQLSDTRMKNDGQIDHYCRIRYNRTALEDYAHTDAISLLCSISTRSYHLQSGPTIIRGLEIPWTPKILQNIRLLAEYHTTGLATDPC